MKKQFSLIVIASIILCVYSSCSLNRGYTEQSEKKFIQWCSLSNFDPSWMSNYDSLESPIFLLTSDEQDLYQGLTKTSKTFAEKDKNSEEKSEVKIDWDDARNIAIKLNAPEMYKKLFPEESMKEVPENIQNACSCMLEKVESKYSYEEYKNQFKNKENYSIINIEFNHTISSAREECKEENK